MSFPFRYSSASMKTRFSPSKPRPYDESTMCCSALSGSPRCRTRTSASSPVMLKRGPSAVSSTPTVASMPNAVMTRFRKSTMAVVFMVSAVLARRIRLAAADPLHPPLGRRTARRARDLRRADHVVGQVLLPDRPDVVHEPVQRDAGRIPQEEEREEHRHQHRHLLLNRIHARRRREPLLPDLADA